MIISDSTSADQLQNTDSEHFNIAQDDPVSKDALDACINESQSPIKTFPQGNSDGGFNEEPDLSKPTFSDNISKASQSAKKAYQSIQDKENTNIDQIQTSQGSTYMHKSTSDINYQQISDDNMDNDTSNYKENSVQSSIRSSQKKKAKRSQSKDPKIMQTMKAYFPGLNQVKEQKKNAFPQQAQPAPKQIVYGNRSSTQGSNNGKAQVYNERIIFVEDSRKGKKNAAQQQQQERRNSNLQSANGNQGSSHQSNSQSYRKNVTQLPPIDKRAGVEVLDQQQTRSPRQHSILSPIMNINDPTVFPDATRVNMQMHQSWSAKRQQEENLVVIVNGESDNQQKKTDYERKNLERIQKMQEKKMLEQKMMEDQRRKAMKKQEKLKKLILQQAAEHRVKKAQEPKQQQEDQSQQKSPKKRKANSQPPTEDAEGEEGGDDEKKNHDMMKKFYRNRYASFLKTLQNQNKKKEQDVEELRKVEEKKKAKLKENIGIGNVQSRFLEDLNKINKDQAEVREKVIVEEVSNKGKKDKPKRGSSQAGLKTMTSVASFGANSKTDQSMDVIKIYQQTVGPVKRERSDSKSLKRALTPKVKKSKKVIVMGNQVVDEKDEEEMIKEQKAKKEAAEKIRQRQQKYLQDLQDKKEKEQKLQEEEKKKQDKLKQQAREAAKQNFEKLQNQPGLKELQDKQQKKTDDDEEEEKITEKKKTKKSKAPETGFEAFIERNNPKRTNFPNITDMALWKKKFKVDENTKVFICTGGYPDIKKALKQRGWVQNKDPTSPCFDLKWVLKAKEIDHNAINDNQLVNHFNKAAAITTKVGLCHNLKNLIWFNNVDIDTFYPRCFDLAMQEELEDYIQEFKAVKAETYVKTFVRQMRESGGDKTTVTDKILKVALKVCEKRLKDLDDLIDDPTAFSSLVTDEEWKILGADELTAETLAQKKHEDWMLKNEVQNKKNKEKEEQQKKKKKKRKTKPVQEDEKPKEEENKADDNEDEDEVENEDNEQAIAAKHPEFKRAVKILEELKKKFPQFGLNGEDNIWIIKPAGLSRGRGIVLYKQLVEILDLVKSKESQYIAQKYIENTMIVKKRKFDIRQWVLVTDWNPLTIWLYKEPYFRFPASDYNADNIMDKFIHLTNNSIGKYAENANTAYHIPDNMMDFQEFNAYLQEQYGWDVWEDKLNEQTKNIVINTLESVQDNFECKKGCFELYGFDLMIDEDFNMWLIEVNSSPAMDYSTEVTTKLVKMVLEDTIKVVVDYASAKKKSKVDTGAYECIYKAKRIVDRPMQSFGLNLVCEGKKIASNKLSHY